MAVELTPEIIETVLERISAGESLRAICRESGMPQIQQIMRLRVKDEVFAEQYACAREMQAEQFYDELIEIADDGTNDWMAIQKDGETVGWRENGEAIRRSVLRVDARKWAMSKILVKRYGDKPIQVTGPEGGPIQQAITVEFVKTGS